MTEQDRQEVLDIIVNFMETYGSQVGSERVVDLTESELTDENLTSLIIPAMRPTTQEWVQTTLKTMMRPITRNISDLDTIKTQTIAAKDAANTAAAGAANVNATLTGYTVTITDRTGVQRSVDIGFYIDPDHVYESKEQMKSAASVVDAGQFCIIATTDPTDPDNATLWIRNSLPSTSAEPYTFLSDLDQASSAAWADWLENMKPQIEAATDAANDAADRVDDCIATADADHTRAEGDHTTAGQDHTQATQDHENYTADRQTFATDEAARQQTFETNEAQRGSTFTTNEAARQSTFNTNEAARQQAFEDAEDERMANTMLTRCYIDFETMCLMFVQPKNDTTDYKVQNGDLKVTFQYDV